MLLSHLGMLAPVKLQAHVHTAHRHSHAEHEMGEVGQSNAPSEKKGTAMNTVDPVTSTTDDVRAMVRAQLGEQATGHREPRHAQSAL